MTNTHTRCKSGVCVCVCMLVYVCKTDNQEKKEPDAGPAVQTVVQILHLVAASFSTGLLPS